jgi:opacity protein-like surface antigen
LVYGTAGGAYVHAKGAGSTTPLTWHYDNMFRPVGGGGIEYAVRNNLSLRAEVLGYLGKNTFNASSDDTATVKNIWVGRIGLSYKFD